MSSNMFFFHLLLKTSLESVLGPFYAAVQLRVMEMFCFCYCPWDLQEVFPWDTDRG